MPPTISKFLNNQEGADYLAGLSALSTDKYPHRGIVKVYPGQNWAIFRYDEIGINPVILCKAKIVSIGMNAGGITGQMLDCRNNQLYEVNHIPSYACGYGVCVSFPQRTYIEKTLKVVGECDDQLKVSQGIAAGMLIMQQENPTMGAWGADFIDQWSTLKEKFSEPSKYYAAMDAYRALCTA